MFEEVFEQYLSESYSEFTRCSGVVYNKLSVWSFLQIPEWLELLWSNDIL